MITKYFDIAKTFKSISSPLNYIQKNFFSDDLSSTFKSRSKLNEFFKYTHPDVLSNAPVS